MCKWSRLSWMLPMLVAPVFLWGCDLFGGPSEGARFQGTVTSAVDGAPLEGAYVSLEVTEWVGLFDSRKWAWGNSSQTDANGRYSIERGDKWCDHRLTISVRLVAYQPLGATGARYSDGLGCSAEPQIIDFALQPQEPWPFAPADEESLHQRTASDEDGTRR